MSDTPVDATGRTRLIAETDLLKVMLHEGKSEFCLMTFSPMRRIGPRSLFWGDAFCIKNEVTTVGFVAKGSHWYPRDDVLRTIATIAQELPAGLPRITYGFSMGAYAALKFSAALDASCALAFSPQFSIDPAEISDHRFRENFKPHNLAMGLLAEDLCSNNFIVYDEEFPLDRKNARMIRRVNPRKVRLMNVPYVGHATINLVTSSAVLNPILRDIGASPADAFRSVSTIVRMRRRALPSYYELLARKVRRSGRRDLAERILKLGAELTSDDVGLILYTARSLGETDPAEAAALLTDAASRSQNPRLRANLATYLTQLGQHERAAELRNEIEMKTGRKLSSSQPEKPQASRLHPQGGDKSDARQVGSEVTALSSIHSS